jgi:hypothetical protein
LTQDEILDALHKVVQENKHYTTWTVSTPHLVALVNLAIEQEREAIAKMVEPWLLPEYVEKIRARGQA